MKKLFRRGVVFGLAVLPALGALNSTAWAASHLEKWPTAKVNTTGLAVTDDTVTI